MRSPINWFGGKGHLTTEILPLIPPHDTYVEPFSGGASVFFAKEPSTIETMNDMDNMIVNLFRVLRNYPNRFRRMITSMPHSRLEFEESKEVLRKNVLDEDVNERINAALYFFLACRQSISAGLSGWSYSIRGRSRLHKWIAAIDGLEEVHERLRHAQIEHIDALDCIKRYDTPKTFFYVDPPYHTSVRSKTRYRVDFDKHANLLHLLNDVKGSWLLSGYHCSQYDRIAERYKWHWKDIETVNRSAATTKSTGLTGDGKLLQNQARTEVLWWNENLVRAGHQITIFEVEGVISNGE